jgi:P-type E1-E2 ATPase
MDFESDAKNGPGELRLQVPGRGEFAVRHLLVDLNGTLAVDGHIPNAVRQRLRRLAATLSVRVLTADTFGTAQAELGGLPVTLERAGTDRAKVRVARALKREGVVAVGNGANDVAMLRNAALAIAVLGREGMDARLCAAADVVVARVEDGLDLLLRPRRLVATLRR